MPFDGNPRVFACSQRKLDAELEKILAQRDEQRRAAAQQGLPPLPIENLTVIVREKPGLGAPELSSIIMRAGGRVAKQYGIAGAALAQVPEDRIAELANAAEVDANRAYQGTLAESVPLINAPQAWALGYNGSGVRIAVLDTGVNATHPMLAGRVVLQNDFTNSTSGPDDVFGHGTHVAGIAAGSNASGGLYNGAAPAALVMNAKVLSDAGYGTTDSILSGLAWALKPDGAGRKNGANVIVMSLGGPYSTPDDPLIAAIKSATDAGAVVVVASGNCGSGCPASYCNGFVGVTTPGNSPDAITVGATDKAKQWACFSGGGTAVGGGIKPDLSAPGVSISSSVPGGYRTATGTSMAAPFVAGVSALLLQKYPNLPPATVKTVLSIAASDLGDPGKDPKYGSGFLDALAAVKVDVGTLANLTIKAPANILRTAPFTITVKTSVPLASIAGKVTHPSGYSSPLSYINTSALDWTATYSNTTEAGVYSASAIAPNSTATAFITAANYSLSADESVLYNGTAAISAGFKNFEAINRTYGAWLSVLDGVGNTMAQTQPSYIMLQPNANGSVSWQWKPNATGSFTARAAFLFESVDPATQQAPVNVTMPQAGSITNVYAPGQIMKGTNATYAITARNNAAFAFNASLEVYAVLEDKLLKLFASDPQPIQPGAEANFTAGGAIPLQGGSYTVRVFLAYGGRRESSDTTLSVTVPPKLVVNSFNAPPITSFGQPADMTVNVTSIFNQSLDVSLSGMAFKNGTLVEIAFGEGGVLAPGETRRLKLPFNFASRSGKLVLSAKLGYENNTLEAWRNITLAESKPPVAIAFNISSSYAKAAILLNATALEDSLVTNASYLRVKTPNGPNIIPVSVISLGNASFVTAAFYNTSVPGTYYLNLFLCDELGNCAAQMGPTDGVAVEAKACGGKLALSIESGRLVQDAISNQSCVSPWDDGYWGEPPASYFGSFDAVFWSKRPAETISANAVKALRNYAEAGGKVFLAGGGIASGIVRNAGQDNTSTAVPDFQNLTGTQAAGMLSAQSPDGSSSTVQAAFHRLWFGMPNGAPLSNESQSRDFILNSSGFAVAAFNDSLTPAVVAAKDGAGKSVFVAFPLSAMNPAERQRLLANSLQWLTNPPFPGISITGLAPSRYFVADGLPNKVLVGMNASGEAANASAYWDGLFSTALLANDSFQLDAPSPVGPHQLVVQAASTGPFDEDDYSDNAAAAIFRVAPNASDARVLSITQGERGPGFSTATVAMENAGGLWANGTLSWLVDGVFRSVENISIAPGGNATGLLKFSAPPGMHLLTARISNPGDFNASDNELNLTAFTCNRPKLLVVGDDDAEQSPQSAGASVGEFRTILGSAGFCIDAWSVAAQGIPALQMLANYSGVVWAAGNAWGTVLNETEQGLLENYSGALLLEGSDLAFDHSAGDNDSSREQALAHGGLYKDFALAPNESAGLNSSFTNASAIALAGLNATELYWLAVNGSFAPFPDAMMRLQNETGDFQSAVFYAAILAPQPNSNGTKYLNGSDIGGEAIYSFRSPNRTLAYFGFALPSLQPQSARGKVTTNIAKWLVGDSQDYGPDLASSLNAVRTGFTTNGLPTYTITENTSNQGNAKTMPTTTQTTTGGTTLLFNKPELQAGAWKTDSFQINCTTTQTQWINSTADYGNNVFESNENNNNASLTLDCTPGPDLASTLSATRTGFTTNGLPTYTITENTSNQGNAKTMPTTTQTTTGGTTLLFNKPELQAGAWKTDSFQINCTTTQAQWANSTADYGNNVFESNENNNNASLLLFCAPTPDLASSITATKTAYLPTGYPGHNVTVTTSNIGFGSAGPSTTLVGVGSASGNFAVKPLAANSSQADWLAYNCTAPGPVKASSQADFDNRVAETNEANNAANATLDCTPIPDLTSSLSTSLSGYAPNGFPAFNVTETTSNIAAGDAPASTTKVAFDTTSINFSKRQLSQGASQTDSLTYNCTATGNHTLFSTADSANKITEVNKLNNFASAEVSCNPVPNLASGLNFTLLGYLPTGLPAYLITETTSNTALGSAAATTTKLAFDATVLTLNKTALPPGASQSYTLAYNCTTPGGHSFSSSADSANKITEVTKLDNNASLSISCTSLPDLTSRLNSSFAGYYLPTGFPAYLISETTSNIAAGDAPASTTKVAFDTTSINFSKRQLSQGASQTDSLTYNCTTAGNHTIASTADSANKITEVNKLNNNASLTIACAIAPDLSSVLYAPYAVTVGKMAYAPIGSSINVTENTWNYGLAPSPASTTSVLYDGASRTFAKPALQPRGGSTSSFSYACASAGARFINSTADYNNAIAETNETNNADWLAVNCTTGLPDLLSSLTVPNTIFSNGAFYAKFGSTVTVVETTWNTGPSPAGASVTRASLPPRKAGGQSQTLYFNKPALAPGRGYSTPGYFYCGASFYTASATADYNNRVVEGNEGNNFNTITILCV